MRIEYYENKINEITDRLAGMIDAGKIDNTRILDNYVKQEVLKYFNSDRDAKRNNDGEIIIDIIGEGERVPAGDVCVKKNLFFAVLVFWMIRNAKLMSISDMRLIAAGLIKKLQTIEVK